MRTLTRLDEIRRDMRVLGQSERSARKIFSCSDELLVAHRDVLLPGIQLALRGVSEGKRWQRSQSVLPIGLLEKYVVALSEHMLRAAPVLALHAPFVASVLNESAQAELQRLRRGRSAREAPVRAGSRKTPAAARESARPRPLLLERRRILYSVHAVRTLR